VAWTGEPIVDGAAAPLVEDEGTDGRVVLDVEQMDEDRERLFASFAYQLSVALQKARLYSMQIEAAEVANALLEAGRELATAESPDEVLRRTVEVTARALNVPRTSLWIQEEGEPHDLVARASHGYTPDRDPARGRRFSAAVAQEWLTRPEPFVLEPSDAAGIDGVDPERANRFVVAPLKLEGGRVGALVSTVEDREIDGRQLRLVSGLAHQVKLAIESAENYEGLERTFVATVATLANALEAKDEYTSTHT